MDIRLFLHRRPPSAHPAGWTLKPGAWVLVNSQSPHSQAQLMALRIAKVHIRRTRSAQFRIARGTTAHSSARQPSANPWLALVDQDRLLRQRALFAAQQGDFLFAIKAFNQLIERNSESAADYNNRGLVYFQCGQMSSALADYNYAIRLSPELANVYNNRANYYAALGDLSSAIEDYEQALRLDPMNVRAWVNQGITFREMELFEQAIENFDQALNINGQTGDQTMQQLLAGHIFAERGRTNHLAGDWNCAIMEYHRAIEALNAPDTSFDCQPDYLRHQLSQWLKELTQPSRG
jgi:tetratricopeptide (TPR) repeat protein